MLDFACVTLPGLPPALPLIRWAPLEPHARRTRSMSRTLALIVVAVAGWTLALPDRPARGEEAKADPEQRAFFEEKVRPILESHCYQLPWADKAEGRPAARLATRDDARRRIGADPRAGRSRGEPADRGHPLRRRHPDAAQAQARRGRDRRADPLGQAGGGVARVHRRDPRAAPRADPGHHRRGPRVLVLPADPRRAPAGRRRRVLAAGRPSIASSWRSSRRKGSGPSARPPGGP